MKVVTLKYENHEIDYVAYAEALKKARILITARSFGGKVREMPSIGGKVENLDLGARKFFTARDKNACSLKVELVVQDRPDVVLKVAKAAGITVKAPVPKIPAGSLVDKKAIQYMLGLINGQYVLTLGVRKQSDKKWFVTCNGSDIYWFMSEEKAVANKSALESIT